MRQLFFILVSFSFCQLYAAEKPAAELIGHNDVVLTIAFNANKSIIATAGRDKEIFIWDIIKWKIVAKLTGHTDIINKLAFTHDGDILASASNDATIRIWDMRSMKETGTIIKHNLRVLAIDYKPGKNLLASSGADENIYFWNTPNYSLDNTIKGSYPNTNILLFCNDGKYLVTTTEDKQGIRVLDSLKYELVFSHNNHRNSIKCISVRAYSLTDLDAISAVAA